MKKRVLITIGVVMSLVAVLLAVLLLNLGLVIKTAVNTYGPDITKTEVHLSDVDVSLLSARAEIKGFYLGNPSTFQSPKAVVVESVYLDVDKKSLTKDPIIIEKIEVIAPHITYERRDGTDNFKTILNNVKEKTDTETVPEKKPGEKGEVNQEKGKRFIIRDLVIRDGKVTLAVSALGGYQITTPLPDIHLTNIGQKQGGASPAEATREIVAALYEKITGPAVTDALNDQLKKLGSSVEAAGSEVTKRAKDLEEKLKGFLGK